MASSGNKQSRMRSPTVMLGNKGTLFYSEAGDMLARRFTHTQDTKVKKLLGEKELSKQQTVTGSSKHHNFRMRTSSRGDLLQTTTEMKRVLPVELSSPTRTQFPDKLNTNTDFSRTLTEVNHTTKQGGGGRSTMSGLDRRVYSDLSLFTQVKELQGYQNSNFPINTAILRMMMSVLRSVVNTNSSLSDLMDWMINCIEDNLFVGSDPLKDSTKEIVEHLRVLKVFQIQQKDVTYRTVATLLAQKEPKNRNEPTFFSSSLQPEIPEGTSADEKSHLEQPKSNGSPEQFPTTNTMPYGVSAKGSEKKLLSKRGNSSRVVGKIPKQIDGKMSVFFKKSPQPQVAQDSMVSKLDTSNESETGKDPSVNFMVVGPVTTPGEMNTPSGQLRGSTKQAPGDRSPHNSNSFHKHALLGVATHSGERANSVAFRNSSQFAQASKPMNVQKSEYGGDANRSYRQSIMTDANDFEDSENMSVVYKNSHANGEPSISAVPLVGSDPLLLIQELRKLTEENTQLKSNHLSLKQELITAELQHKKTLDSMTVELELGRRTLNNQSRVFSEAQYFLQVVRSAQEKMKNAVAFATAMNNAVLERVDRIISENGLCPDDEVRIILPPNLAVSLEKLGLSLTGLGLSEEMEFETMLDILLQIHVKGGGKKSPRKSVSPLSRGMTQMDRNDGASVGSTKKVPVGVDSKASGKIPQLQALKQISRSPSMRKKSMVSDQNPKENSTSGAPVLKSQKTIRDKSPVAKSSTQFPKRDTLMPTNTMIEEPILQAEDEQNGSVRIDQEGHPLDSSRGAEQNDASFDFDKDDPSPKMITIGEKKQYKMVISTPQNDRLAGSQKLVTQKSIKGSRPASPNVESVRKPVGRIGGPLLVRQHSKSINTMDTSPAPKKNKPVAQRTKESKVPILPAINETCLPPCANLNFLVTHIKDNIQNSLSGLNTCLAELEKGVSLQQEFVVPADRPAPLAVPTATRGKPLLQRRETLGAIGNYLS